MRRVLTSRDARAAGGTAAASTVQVHRRPGRRGPERVRDRTTRRCTPRSRYIGLGIPPRQPHTSHMRDGHVEWSCRLFRSIGYYIRIPIYACTFLPHDHGHARMPCRAVWSGRPGAAPAARSRLERKPPASDTLLDCQASSGRRSLRSSMGSSSGNALYSA